MNASQSSTPASTSNAANVTERGGVLVRQNGQMYFLAQECVLRIVPRPPIERVPGSPPELLGITLDNGTLLPVIALDEAETAGPLLVCRYAGEAMALSGLTILASGRYPTVEGDPPSTVRYEGDVIPHLDLAAAYDLVQPGPWAGRFAR